MDIGLQVFSSALGIGILGAWLPQRNERRFVDAYAFPGFRRPPRYAGSLAIRRRALLIWSGCIKQPAVAVVGFTVGGTIAAPGARAICLWRSPRLPAI